MCCTRRAPRDGAGLPAIADTVALTNTPAYASRDYSLCGQRPGFSGAPQAAYSGIGYGAHGLGFIIADGARYTMQMLCVLAADKSLGLGLFAMAFGAAAASEVKPEL